MGEGTIDAIIKSRQEKGKPKDIFEFVNNIDISEINKKALESLIKAGALDCLDSNRAKHLAVYETLIESAQNSSRKNIAGQLSLFQTNTEVMQDAGVGGSLPDIENFSKDILMSMEKDMLGVYITDHPLSEYEDMMARIVTATSEDLSNIQEGGPLKDGATVTMAGMISSKRTLVTKNNKMMAFLQLEDFIGTTEVIVFPNVYERILIFFRMIQSL